MEGTDSRRLTSLYRQSSDLAAVLGLTALTWIAVFLPVVRETPVRPILGLLFTLFVPGYAFVAALFPGGETETAATDETDRARAALLNDHGMDILERTVFSFGTSIVVASLLVIVLHFTWRIGLLPVLEGLSAVTVLATGIAVIRRSNRTDTDVQFYLGWENLDVERFRDYGYANHLINGVLLVGLLFGAGGITYLVTVHDSGSFTEFYVLTQNESGEFVATEYLTVVGQDESVTLFLHVENHENERVNYTIIAAIQRVRIEDGSVNVLEQQKIERFTPVVNSGANWSRQHTVSPAMDSDHLRVVYLLYRDRLPDHPTIDNAYLELHRWLNGSNTQAKAVQSIEEVS